MQEIAIILKQYKTKSGDIDFPKIMGMVPSAERIPAMFQKDFLRTTALVGMGIASAFERMRFKKKIDGALINNIAEEVIDSADDDNLSFEDLMLFLQGLVRGKYGNIEDISISRFMNLFDIYRTDRHNALMEYRENQHLQHKGMGDGNRTSKDDPMADSVGRLGNTISELKDRLKYEQTLNKIDKF